MFLSGIPSTVAMPVDSPSPVVKDDWSSKEHPRPDLLPHSFNNIASGPHTVPPRSPGRVLVWELKTCLTLVFTSSLMVFLSVAGPGRAITPPEAGPVSAIMPPEAGRWPCHDEAAAISNSVAVSALQC